MIITRSDRTVSAIDDVTGRMMRSEECRNVQCAVTLHWKLSSDQKFADLWVRDVDPKFPEVNRHELEWEPLDLPANIARRVLATKA